jgi:hypothetical protein
VLEAQRTADLPARETLVELIADPMHMEALLVLVDWLACFPAWVDNHLMIRRAVS